MSYSFSVRGASKAEAIEKAHAELDKVVALQPVHAVDVAQAKATVTAFVGVLPDDEARDIGISCNGSVCSNAGKTTSAGIGVTAYLADKT